jgi:hypothetical protein
MQVGISASCFANNNRTAQFDFFMLDATNIVPYVSPPAASAPELTAFTNSTITLTWSNGTGSAGSIVVMRAGRPVNVQPVNGVTYVDSPTFGQGSNLGSSNYVVYVGTGTSVTVSNLIPGIVYHAAVFSYSGAGASTLYNTTEAQASSVTAQGQISKIYVRLPSGTNVLNQGAAFYTVDVVYTSAVTNDVTGTAVLFFDPPTAAAYNTNGLGIFTPMTNIPFNVYAVFSTSSGLNATNTDLATVTTHEPVLIDNFDVNHDYLATGVGGTIFDGVYFGDVANHPSNSIPGGVGTTSPGLGLTTIADANVSSNGYLTVQHSGTGWEFAEDDGFLLLKNISGNFQASVHVFEATDGFFPPTANANVGLMARAAGAAGGPFGGAGEDWISWSRFDLFGIQNDGRSTLDGGTTRLEVRDGTTNYWLMIVRNGNTFYFMERPTTNDAWFVRNNFTTVRSDFGGQPLQVGIQAAMFAAATGKTLFDHFALDGTANRPILAHARSGGNLTLSWSTAYAAYTLQSSSSVLPGSATWSSVATAPVITNGLINVTVPTSSAAAFYRLVR